jgi:hypothetical protein
MHLDGETFPGVQDLEEQGKARRLGKGVAENLGAPHGPELVESLAAERFVMDDALGLGAIHHLPGFAYPAVGRQALAEVAFEPPPAPGAIHEDRLEDNRG